MMSKDKGSKNTKKAPDKTSGKHVSDYKADNKSKKEKNADRAALASKPDMGVGSKPK
jgi:hypothetical protein